MRKIIIIIAIAFSAIGAGKPISHSQNNFFKMEIGKWLAINWPEHKSFESFQLQQEIQSVDLERVEEIAENREIYLVNVKFKIIFYDDDGVFDKALMYQKILFGIQDGKIIGVEWMDAVRIYEG